MKISEVKLPPVIGVGGLARCGKDTFCALTSEIMSKYDQKIMRSGFADAVKSDLHQLLVKKVGISAYTEIPEEKELIRPLLVEYGTGLMRKINENVWVDRMQLSLDLAKATNMTLIITDVRYVNEVDWIHSQDGIMVYVEQTGNKPANEEEKANDPLIKKKANASIKWDKVGDKNIKKLKPKVSKILKEISC